MENQQDLSEVIKECTDKIVASNLTLAIVLHEQNTNRSALPWKSPQLLYHELLKGLRPARASNRTT